MSIQFERAEVSLKKQVIDSMRNAIIDGTFLPGQKLVERELCELFDVSRSLMREALQKLEAEALITIVPHRGPAVAEITLEEATSIYAVRQALEALAGAGCAQHASEEDIAALEVSLQRVAACQGNADQKALVQAKNEFYRVLLKACGNPIVQEMLTGLNNRINSLRRFSMSQPGRLPHTVKELKEIIGAIRSRDAERASKLCAEHVGKAATIALRVMAEQKQQASSAET
ncbi:GntR family transcriptional regulator [Bordetella muralis]|uniref:GntR family transcriptional regulator n=1 Tax=Bordetella muralis TaxID=1649130 RepID=UPI0039F07E58